MKSQKTLDTSKQKDYIEIRPEAPGVWAKDLNNLIPIYFIGTADSEKFRCVKRYDIYFDVMPYFPSLFTS